MISIEIRALAASEIYNYLIENDQLFIPPLSSRVNVKDYALKLSKFAVHFCAISNLRLVGFLGCYFNEPLGEFAYISTLSITGNLHGKGIAKNLLNAIIQYGSKNKINEIRLQVHVSNLPAMKLYSEYGFEENFRNNQNATMILKLKNSEG